MNLKIKTPLIELELQNADVTRVEKALFATFAFLQGGSFNQTFENTEAEERPTNSKRNFIEPIDGVRTHENGTKEYKCTYHCTCGNKGVRYVHADATKTTCHKCKKELDLHSSTLNDLHDNEFNYFLAY